MPPVREGEVFMGAESPGESIFSKFKVSELKSIKLSQERLVKTSSFDPEGKFTLVVEPDADNVNLVAWAKTNLQVIERQLLEYGAILFRDFQVERVVQFRDFAQTVSGELIEYNERAAPRVRVDESIYTSTEYPPDQRIPSHHEMAYSHNWPQKIFLFCVEPASYQGRTPIADGRRFIQLIDPAIKKPFVDKKVLYVRNYGEGVDMPWQVAFQTSDRTAVEQYCRKARIEVEWRDGDRLRTRAIRHVIVTHPKTGEAIWFNHAHLFHLSNLAPQVREALLSEFAEDELPRNVFYGDGSSIETSILEEIRELYDQIAVTFPWRKGDVLMLDNFLTSHGREPYEGPRKILVALADLFTSGEYL
jgi:alpha-ketoglutarate-dependent taurine dioxygenase